MNDDKEERTDERHLVDVVRHDFSIVKAFFFFCSMHIQIQMRDVVVVVVLFNKSVAMYRFQ